jgi:flagellar motor switch protein FliN/FliY
MSVSNEKTGSAALGTDRKADAGGSPMEAASVDRRNLDVVLDIPVRLSMEVGSTSISIRRLLQLNKGSVVELTRLAGDPLDVLVNGTLVAHGEVVVVNDKFGIRLTDVVSPEQRIKSLN